MMSDAVLQVLLLLAYLAIGLVSVTFPIYAICVTYLRREKWESEKTRKERINKLKEHISKLTDELSGEPKDSERFRQIEDRIEKHESEKESLEFLSAKGAVRKPIISLAIALSAAILGIQFFYSENMELALGSALLCGALSAIFSSIAIYRLYKTLSAVEYAALRPAPTIDFDVYFEGGGRSREVKRGKRTNLKILWGSEEENVEKVEATIMIHPELKLVSTNGRSGLQIPPSDYPDYTAIQKSYDILHKETYDVILITVSPSKTGKYELPVSIKAMGISEYETRLIIHVVK